MVQRLFEWETSFFCQYIFSLILMIVSPKVCKFQFIYFCNRTVKNNLLWNLHLSK